MEQKKDQFPADLSEAQRRELLDITAAAADAKAAFTALTAAGYQVTEETAARLFERVNTPPPMEMLSDEDLENVAGGCGCGDCSDCSDCKNNPPPKPI